MSQHTSAVPQELTRGYSNYCADSRPAVDKPALTTAQLDEMDRQALEQAQARFISALESPEVQQALGKVQP